MKKFLGVKKRGFHKGSSSSGKSLKDKANCNSISISSPSPSSTGVQSKEHRLVMLMNKAGMKMQELRNILHQESVLAHREPDTLKLRAFLRHYTRQTEVVDAIRNSDSNSNIRGKEGYHCFLEDLLFHQNFSQSQNESNLGDCSNVSGNNGCDTVVSATDITDDGHPHDETVPEGDRCEISEVDGRMDASTLVNRPSTDVTSREVHIPKIIINDGKGEDRGVTSSSSDRPNYLPLSKSKCLNNDVEFTEEDKSRTYLKKYFRTTDLQSLLESNLSNESDQDIIDASLGAYKNKVIRRPKKPRGRLDELFPLIPDSESLTKPMITSTPLSSEFRKFEVPPIVDTFSRSPIESSLMAGGDSEDASPWKDRSKSKNESWYEFKERCSRTSLHGNSLQGHSPQGHSTPTGNSAQKSPFMIKDYIDAVDGPGSLSVTSPKAKCVRFNLSLEPDDNVTSAESSSDDEAPFEVDQFPCAKPIYKKLHRSK